MQNDFFTPASAGSFAGATAMIVVISAALRRAFNSTSLMVPFVSSMVVTFTLAYTTHTINEPIGWVLAFVNGCMLFLTAIGANETAANAAQPSGPAASVIMGAGGAQASRAKFVQSYFHK